MTAPLQAKAFDSGAEARLALRRLEEGLARVIHGKAEVVRLALAATSLVIATQNPLAHFGTHPLPESPIHTFMLRLRMGYPDPRAERRVVTAPAEHDAVEEMPALVELGDVIACQQAAARVRVD